MEPVRGRPGVRRADQRRPGRTRPGRDRRRRTALVGSHAPRRSPQAVPRPGRASWVRRRRPRTRPQRGRTAPPGTPPVLTMGRARPRPRKARTTAPPSVRSMPKTLTGTEVSKSGVRSNNSTATRVNGCLGMERLRGMIWLESIVQCHSGHFRAASADRTMGSCTAPPPGPPPPMAPAPAAAPSPSRRSGGLPSSSTTAASGSSSTPRSTPGPLPDREPRPRQDRWPGVDAGPGRSGRRRSGVPRPAPGQPGRLRSDLPEDVTAGAHHDHSGRTARRDGTRAGALGSVRPGPAGGGASRVTATPAQHGLKAPSTSPGRSSVSCSPD